MSHMGPLNEVSLFSTLTRFWSYFGLSFYLQHTRNLVINIPKYYNQCFWWWYLNNACTYINFEYIYLYPCAYINIIILILKDYYCYYYYCWCCWCFLFVWGFFLAIFNVMKVRPLVGSLLLNSRVVFLVFIYNKFLQYRKTQLCFFIVPNTKLWILKSM